MIRALAMGADRKTTTMTTTKKTSRATAEERRCAVNALGAIRNQARRIEERAAQVSLDNDEIAMITEALENLHGVMCDLDKKLARRDADLLA